MPDTPPSTYKMGSWTVTRLRDELRSRNLSPVGNKPQLVERLAHANSESGTTPISVRIRRSGNPSQGKSPAKMNVNQLQEELKGLGMSPVGNKTVLMQRLQEAQASAANPFVESNQSQSPSRRKTPVKTTPTARVGEMSEKRIMDMEDVGLLTSPITTILLALRCGRTACKDALGSAQRFPLALLNLVAFVMLVVAVNMIEGPHQVYLRPVQDLALWYGRWAILGVLSSIGLGTGAHTFLLFLGPFIAKVTTAAYVCQTINFPLMGENALLCPAGAYTKSVMTIWMILNKVKFEAFAWGLGTAIGELPPYLISRASAAAGKSSGEINQVEEIAAKKRVDRTWSEVFKLASYDVVSRSGFMGILLCASIPNPLFDIAGITCGYFMVPFTTFLLATFLGKAVIKAGIQATFVVCLFSRDYLEQAISYVQKRYPSMGKGVYQWLLAQRTVFQTRRPDPMMETIGSLWHILLILVMAYFAASVIRSAAIMQAKREGLLKPSS